MATDRGLASAPNTIEVVKISIPRGLFLIVISYFRYAIGCIKVIFDLPLGGRFGLFLKTNNKKIKFVSKILREMRSDFRILYVCPNWLLYSIPINGSLSPTIVNKIALINPLS